MLLCKKKKKKLGVDLSVHLYHKVGQSLKPNINKERYFNAITIHYCNRVIDFKSFYSKPRWYLWRELYLLLVVVKRTSSNLTLSDSIRLYRRVKYITSKNVNITKKLYDNIMHNQIKEKYNA